MKRIVNQAGASLIELVVSIVIIGVAVVGVLSVITRNTESSADPLVREQAVAIAQAYMEEIFSLALTDPDGSNAGEVRNTYDDVADYNGLQDLGARDQRGQLIPGLEGYTVDVAVTDSGVNGRQCPDWNLGLVGSLGPGGNAVAGKKIAVRVAHGAMNGGVVCLGAWRVN